MPCADRCPGKSLWLGREGRWTLESECILGEDGSVGCCGDAACLRQHLADAHKDVFVDACGAGLWHMHYSMYLEAIACKEQETMPKVGASVDRRAFGHVAADVSDESVRAMVCMCCARVALSTNGATAIAMVKAGE